MSSPEPASAAHARHAAAWQDQYEADHPAAGPASRFHWRFEPEYPLSRLAVPTAEMRVFMEEEIAAWAEDGDPERYRDEITRPIREPVVIVEIDGQGYIWDGNHRVGASALTDRLTVPALAGTVLADQEETPAEAEEESAGMSM